jgi:hypothetical protein
MRGTRSQSVYLTLVVFRKKKQIFKTIGQCTRFDKFHFSFFFIMKASKIYFLNTCDVNRKNLIF